MTGTFPGLWDGFCLLGRCEAVCEFFTFHICTLLGSLQIEMVCQSYFPCIDLILLKIAPKNKEYSYPVFIVPRDTLKNTNYWDNKKGAHMKKRY